MLGLAGVMLVPPALAIEDTDTPGDRRWEINLGTSGARTLGGWCIAAPEVDLNYGWGERVQLMAAASWITLANVGEPSKSGLGAAIVGAKWRFVDQDRVGFAVSTFPQYSWNPAHSAEDRGIVEPGRRLSLPLAIGVRHGDLGVYGEVIRTLVEAAPNQWTYGVKVLHQCATGLECRVELKHTHVPDEVRQTMASAGVKWNLTESLLLKVGLGREFGKRNDAQENLVLQLGVQILH